MKDAFFYVRLILIFMEKYVISINRKEQHSLSQKSLLKCISPYPSHGVLSEPLQHVGAATHIRRGQQLLFLIPAGSGQQVLVEQGLFGHDHEVSHLTGAKNKLKTKAVPAFSLCNPHVYPKLLSFQKPTWK